MLRFGYTFDDYCSDPINNLLLINTALLLRRQSQVVVHCIGSTLGICPDTEKDKLYKLLLSENTSNPRPHNFRVADPCTKR